MVLKQCRSGVKRTPLHSQALESSHALKEPMLLSTHRALKTPSFLSYFSPSQGKKRGIQTCQLRSGGGLREPPKMYCLETWRQKGWGRAQGLASLTLPPGPWEASKKLPSPSQPSGHRGAGSPEAVGWAQ